MASFGFVKLRREYAKYNAIVNHRYVKYLINLLVQCLPRYVRNFKGCSHRLVGNMLLFARTSPRPPTPEGQRTLLQGGDKWQAIGTVKSEELKTCNSDMAQIQCPSFLRGIIAPKAQ